jgi:hypothetical protein
MGDSFPHRRPLPPSTFGHALHHKDLGTRYKVALCPETFIPGKANFILFDPGQHFAYLLSGTRALPCSLLIVPWAVSRRDLGSSECAASPFLRLSRAAYCSRLPRTPYAFSKMNCEPAGKIPFPSTRTIADETRNTKGLDRKEKP